MLIAYILLILDCALQILQQSNYSTHEIYMFQKTIVIKHTYLLKRCHHGISLHLNVSAFPQSQQQHALFTDHSFASKPYINHCLCRYNVLPNTTISSQRKTFPLLLMQNRDNKAGEPMVQMLIPSIDLPFL